MKPKRLSLGPLEQEIVEILWRMGNATTREVYEDLLQDPDRELASPSVNTVLKRLVQKGWLTCDTQGRVMRWQPTLTQAEAQALVAQEHLEKLLAIADSPVVAAFAEHLADRNLAQLEQLMERIQAQRRAIAED
jgi:predicted transcriptional regulator